MVSGRQEPVLVPRLDIVGISRNFAVVVGAASVIVLQKNSRRSGATFVNDSVNIIYLVKGEPSALNIGIRLNAAGGAYEINASNLYKGILAAIATGAASNLCVTEQE